MAVVICPNCKRTVEVGTGTTCPNCNKTIQVRPTKNTSADAPTLNVPPVPPRPAA